MLYTGTTTIKEDINDGFIAFREKLPYQIYIETDWKN